MKLYQVIAQQRNKERYLSGNLDFIGRYKTLKEAKKIADKMWAEYDKNPNYKYGLIGIEENEYKLNEDGQLEFIKRHRIICKLTNGSWDI